MASRTIYSWVKRSPSHWVKWLVLLTFLVTAWGPGPSAAQSQSDGITGKEKLPEVTVTATRTEESVYNVAQSVTVIDSGYLEKNQVRGVGDMVEQFPGVTVTNGAPRRLGEGLNIRGLTKEQVIVRKDGARVAQFTSGHKGTLFFDMGNVKSAEILRGPSALYGSGALGGVLSLETYDPVDYLKRGQNTGARVNYSYSDAFGEHTGRAKVYGRSDDRSLSWLFGLTARDADEFVDLASNDPADPERLNFAEEEVLNPHGKLIYKPDNTNRLEFSVDAYENEGRTLSNLDDVNTGDTNSYVDRVTEQRTVTLNYERNGSTWWDDALDATVYRNNMELTDNRLDNGSEESGTQDNVEFETLGLDLKNTVERGRHEITYGLEHVVDDQTSSTTRDPGANANTFFPDAEQSKSGFYVQDQVTLLDGRLTVTPAVRYDEWENDPDTSAIESRTEDETSLQLGSVLELTKRWNLTANYSEGFRAPSIQELYNDGLHFAFTVNPNGPLPPPPFTNREFFKPNPDLKPETSQNTDFGLRYESNSLKARANYYEVDAENFIENVVIGSFPNRERQAQNVSKAELSGVEASFEWAVSDHLNLGARYADPEGRDLTNDTKLASVPPENLTLGADWQALDGLTLGAFTRSYSGKTTPNGEYSGYTLFDAYAQWKPSRATRVNLTVNNLTDNAYTHATTGRPGVGRDIRAGFTYAF